MSGTIATTFVVIPDVNFQIKNGSSLAPTSRTLGSYMGDLLNVKDYGISLSGSSADNLALETLYENLKVDSVIIVPAGTINPSSFSPTLATASNYSVFWDFQGKVITSGTSGSTSAEVISLGDGDLVKAYSEGQLQFTRQVTNSPYAFANVSFTIDFNGMSAAYTAKSISGNVIVNATASSGSVGNLWNFQAYSTAGSTNGGSINNMVSYIYKSPGSNQPTLQFYGHTDDQTGNPGGMAYGSVTGTEQDIAANGPELPSTVFSPTSGSRNIVLLKAHAYTNGWVSGQTYSVGELITPSGNNTLNNPLNLYYCVTAGSSGTIEPTWPTSGSIAIDMIGGSAVLTLSSNTFACQVSRGLQIGSDTNAAIGAGILIQGDIYSAGIDLTGIVPLSTGTLSSTIVSGLRLPPNLGIDFSGRQDSLTTGKRVLLWNGTSGDLEYQYSGTAVVGIDDTGDITSTGGLSLGGVLSVTGDLEIGARTIDLSTAIFTPSSGGTVAISNSCSTCITAGNTTIGTLTVTFPTAAVNQIIKIVPQVSVTTLILNAAGSHTVLGAPASLTAGTWVQKQYNSGKWA